jgi:hypothetical protein
MNSIVNKPALIEYESLRFLVMDSPKDSNVHLYLTECRKYNVKHIVRISEPTYNKELFESSGITIHVSSQILRYDETYDDDVHDNISRKCIILMDKVHQLKLLSNG